MTYEADQDGTLAIVAKEGDTLAVGETIARIGEGGERDGAAPAEREAEEGGDDEQRRGRDGHRDRRGAAAGSATERAAGQRRRRDEPSRAPAGEGEQRPHQGVADRAPDGARARPRARRPAGHRPGRADRQGRRRGRVEGRRRGGRGRGARERAGEAEPEPRARGGAPEGAAAVVSGDEDRQGRDDDAGPHAPAADGRAAHGGVQGDRAGLRPQRRRRHGRGRRPAQAAQGRRGRRPARAVVQRLRGQGVARSRCATSRAPTAPTATASSSSTRA